MKHSCILLVRISTAAQELKSQTEKVKTQAILDGYSDENIYIIEDVESAVKLSEEERNGLNRMKRIISEDDTVDCVYSYEISRISRQPKIIYSIRDYLIERNIQLIILNPFFKLIKEDGTISETANILFGIFASLAEQEGYLRKIRTARGVARAKSEGKLASGRPLYGYRRNKDKTVRIEEDEAKIVREIFSRHESGQSSGVIAHWIYDNGIWPEKTRYKSVLSYINKILVAESYCGNNIYPAIITKEQFANCTSLRQIKNKQCRKYCSVKYDYFLHGVLYSSNGYRMTPNMKANNYSVSNDIEKISINMKYIDSLIKKELIDYINRRSEINEGEEIRQKCNDIIQNNTRAISANKIRIDSLYEEINRINERIVKGRMNESKGDQMIDDNNKLIGQLIEENDKKEHEITDAMNEIIYVTSFVKDGQNRINDITSDDVKKHIKKIIVEKTGYAQKLIEIQFKYETKKIRVNTIKK